MLRDERKDSTTPPAEGIRLGLFENLSESNGLLARFVKFVLQALDCLEFPHDVCYTLVGGYRLPDSSVHPVKFHLDLPSCSATSYHPPKA